ncbi:MAG: S-layer homology domain-containing protein [Acidimicrobiia bacterium]|nr:S-layer homology domain-containing protein [Acidimicrobiia bacterium]MDX2468268.1 S-layer homology domain-containing protein [Acidimicrobiia bacterium]
MKEQSTSSVLGRKLRLALAFVVVLAVMAPVAVIAAGGAFVDDDTSIFEGDIEWMAANAITSGCGPDTYCPEDNVTRGEMAAFMKRLATKKVVDAATAVEADHAASADNATTADSATTATSATSATSADKLDGKDAADFVGTTAPIKLFAAATFETNGVIRSSAGPVTGADVLAPGEYRVNFSEPFETSGTAPIILVTRLNTGGGSCAWSFNGSVDTEIDVSCHTPTGTSANGLFSIVVYVVDPALQSMPDMAWDASSGK